MTVVVMAAARLLERLKGLLCSGQIAVLQGLADLVEYLRKRRVGVRRWTLAVLLELAQRRIGLLGVREISAAQRVGKLLELLHEIRLRRGRRVGIERRVGNSGNRHHLSPFVLGMLGS